MINNEELPIGFTMELAQHSDALVRFSGMTKNEQQEIISQARNASSREEMRHLVGIHQIVVNLFLPYRDLPNTLSNTKIQIPAIKAAIII